MDLAGRDEDEVTDVGVDRRLESRRAPGVASADPRARRSTSRTGRGGGSGSSPRGPWSRPTSRDATDPVVGAEMAIDRSMSACWPTEVRRWAGVTRTAIRSPLRVAMMRAAAGSYPAAHATLAVRAPPVPAPIDEPSPLAPLPRCRPRLGGRADVVDQARGPAAARLRRATSCATSSCSSARRWRRMPTRLVTAGRRWSNHCRLTAAAGAVAGLDVHLVLSGAAGRPAEPGPTARRAARRDGSPGGARRIEPSATTSLPRSSPTSGPPGAVRTPSASAAAGSSARRARSGRRRRCSARRAPLAVGVDAVVPAVGHRRDPGRAPRGAPGRRLDRGSRRDRRGQPTGRAPADDRVAFGRARRPDRRPGRPAAEIELDSTATGSVRVTADRPPAADEASRLLARNEGILVDPDLHRQGARRARSPLVRSGRFDQRTVVFWHAGGLPGLFEPLDGGSPVA